MAVELRPRKRYLWVMFRGLLIFVLMAAPAAAWAAQSGEVSAERPAEYMIYQYPGVSLVVKIDAPEVHVESRIYDPEGALIKSSGIPSGRIGPLYQYVGAVDKPRQLMIKISPERRINRSAINMELIQLPAWGDNSAMLARGYGLLSQGAELTLSNDTTTWAMKTYTLKNAAAAFAAMGWEEMRLWAEFEAAHLILYKLNDELQAMEVARELQASARRAGFELIELAALILEGDAVIAAGAKSGGRVASARFEQIHAIMDRVVILADRQNLKSEQARALFNDGLAYVQQEQPQAAIRQFQSALDVALSADNPELVNDIRSTAATTYESLGSTADAIGMLEDIGGDLENEAGQEVTENLFERGRLLNTSFRYPEAAEELEQALNMNRSRAAGSAPWGPVGLELAWSWYSMGEMDQAANLILESIPRTPQAQNTDALIQAYSSLANIYRGRGEFQQMTIYRDKQGQLAVSARQQADFAFESAMDAWRRGNSHVREAQTLLDRSRREAVAAGNSLAAQRADLYQCLLNVEQQGREGCASGQVSRLQTALGNSGWPKLAMESEFVIAKILRRQGRDDDALAVVERLIEDISRFRQELPGVLGAWYWQTKEDIFNEYMAIVIAKAAPGGSKGVDGKRVLLALDRIRAIESEAPAPDGAGPDSAGEEPLRSLIAQRELATGTEAETLARQVNRSLQDITGKPGSSLNSLTPAALNRLLASLAPDESFLTYYLADSAGYVLIGTGNSVSVSKLSGSTNLSEQLVALRERIQREPTPPLPQLESLGRDLLGPVANRLTKKIYLLPAGALNGFPFDALRLKGKFIAENHQVVNLLSLSAVDVLHPSLPPDFREKVFLAGNPQITQELFSYDVRVSPEISAMTDRFVGPGLHIVQGVALKADEFRDDRFTGAGLIHLAIPGTIDLEFPDRSRLLMSRSGENSVVEYLSPAEIRELHFDTGLVVLSLTQVSGASSSGFSNRLGFVSDFLDRGVGNVLASIWTGEDTDSTAFFAEFYDNLEAGQDIGEAFSQIRKKRLKSGDQMNFKSWAGFQLFIR